MDEAALSRMQAKANARRVKSNERRAETLARSKARRAARVGKKPHRCAWGEERHENGERFMVCGVCGRRLRICSLPEY